MINVVKRTGQTVPFDKDKIVNAIEKAMTSSTGVFVEGQALSIANKIEEYAKQLQEPISISEIEEMVYMELIKRDNITTAKAYEDYKVIRAYQRKFNTIDKDVMSLIGGTDQELLDENSNKNPTIISTQRDLIAGEVSKDIAKRKILPPDIVEAHEQGVIHVHDLDYLIQPNFNCCLVNLKDMLDNGTVVNDKLIETPKSFQVACNVMTQIVAQVASNQYGLPA